MMMRIPLVLFALPLLGAAKVTLAAGSPLFADAEPIRMTITAPMRELLRKRRAKTEFPALMQYEDASGALHETSIKLAARGNSRLDVCDFPPLRVIIDAGQAAGTLFADQRRLKMVTTCKRPRPAGDWLLLEYGIYLAYNQITDFSFRVRRIEVTFRDSDSNRWVREQTAFFIESIGAAARRLQRKSIRPPSIRADQFNKTEMANNVLFQYLIGNTDFAVKRGPSGEGCCHNGRVLTTPGSQNDWIVLPYDFDQSGLMDTDYAMPDERFHIRKVTARLYRGFCWHNEELVDAIALFNERRENIVAALLPDGLSDKKMRKKRQYLDSFFNTVNDTKQLRRQLIDKCRGTESDAVRKTTVSAI